MTQRAPWLAAAAFAGLVAWGAAMCRGGGRPELRLQLSLAKPHWRVGEYLWYRLEARNDGSGRLALNDYFWIDQREIENNLRRGRGTYLEVLDSNGQPARWHFETLPSDPFWTNDIARYDPPEVLGALEKVFYQLRPKLPERLFGPLRRLLLPWIAKGPTGVVELGPGESFAATPSRPRGKSVRPGPLPLEILGKPSNHAPFKATIPQGHRILAGRWLATPGRYRIRAVLDERPDLPPSSAEEEIERLRRSWPYAASPPNAWLESENAGIRRQWAGMTPEDLQVMRRKRSRLQRRYGSAFRAESNFIDFEILP